MHSGKLIGRSKAARLYRLLRRQGYDRWVDAWELAQAIKTTALGTIVAEVRDQLRKQGIAEQIEHRCNHTSGEPRNYYRVVRVAGYTNAAPPLVLEVQG